jgi:hypothetical protein
MNNKKRFFYIEILLLLFVLCFFSGCENKIEYDGSGTAKIIIDFDKIYEDVNVSCPEGKVEKQNNSYIISLNSRKMVDVLISCEGYKTETLNFTTSELSKGELSKTVSLSLKKILINAKIQGVSDISKVTVVSENSESIVDSELNKNKLVIELNELNNQLLTFKCDGYFDYTIQVNSNNFVNYNTDIKVPFVLIDSQNILLTINNDLKIDYYNCYLYQYEYQKIEKSINNNSEYIYLDINKNYRTESNYILSSIELKALFNNGNPYLKLTLSDICTSNNFQYEINTILPEGHKYDTLEIYDEDGNNQHNNQNQLYSSSENIIICLKKYNDTFGWMLTSLYKHTITDEEKQNRELNIEIKFDEFITTIKSYDISDSEIKPFNGGKILINNKNLSEIDSSILLSNPLNNEEVTINLTNLLKEDIFSSISVEKQEGYENYNCYNNYFSFNKLFKPDVNINYSVAKNIKISFENENGEKLLASEVIYDYTDEDFISQVYFENDDITINLKSDYYPTTLFFASKIFNIDDNGFYCYKITLIKVKLITLNVENSSDYFSIFHCYIDENQEEITIYPNGDDYVYILMIEEKYINKTINISGYIDGYNFLNKIKITKEIFETGILNIYVNKLN